MTITEWLRQRCLARVFDSPVSKTRVLPEKVLSVKRCAEFDRLRNNRLLVGAFRYGLTGGYDCIGSAIKRLVAYQETGNQEYLVDTANLCELEFIQKNHPLAHWNAQDDGEHCEAIQKPHDDPSVPQDARGETSVHQ